MNKTLEFSEIISTKSNNRKVVFVMCNSKINIKQHLIIVPKHMWHLLAVFLTQLHKSLYCIHFHSDSIPLPSFSSPSSSRTGNSKVPELSIVLPRKFSPCEIPQVSSRDRILILAWYYHIIVLVLFILHHAINARNICAY